MTFFYLAPQDVFFREVEDDFSLLELSRRLVLVGVEDIQNDVEVLLLELRLGPRSGPNENICEIRLVLQLHPVFALEVRTETETQGRLNGILRQGRFF